MAIKKGDVVSVEYTGKFDSGEIFDSSKGKDPLEFEVGAGQVIKGFDDAVIGMNKGQEKDVKIIVKEAYGEARDDLVKEVPKKVLPKDIEPKVGLVLVLKSAEGRSIGSRIKEIKEDSVLLDFNHPLAGKNLNFKIKVVNIK